MIATLVHPADLSDGQGARALLTPVHKKLTRMKKVWLDSGYKEGCAQWIEDMTGWEVEIVRRPGEAAVWARLDQPVPPVAKGFQLLPHRWIVERTLGWLGRSRRLSKDYEATTASEEAWIWIVMARLLLNRLAPSR